MKELHSILGYISNTKLLGFIPLDIVMHLVVAYIIMVILLKCNLKIIKAYFIVLILCICKEVFDSFSLTNAIEENIKDLLVSMIFPTIQLLISFSKKSEVRRRR